MISLVPDWARHYDAFWLTIRKRNLWLIKLRYGAVLMLLVLFFTSEFILDIKFSAIQEFAILLITFSIFIYNIILHYSRRFVKNDNNKFNPLHLSLIQMVLDLYALTLLVYYTGSIESPLYMLFIFHMIIGSLILPGKIIYSSAIAAIIIFSSITMGEYYSLIDHHIINGLLAAPVYNDLKYVWSFLAIFTFVLIMSVVLANRIARQLYKMEQDLYESLDKIKNAEADKQKYIMGVVHEIKTPISALHSYLDIILQKFLGPLNEKVEEKIKRALIRSNEAIQLINNVLKISKLRLTEEITKEPVDIRKLICSVITKQQINVNSKKIKLTLKDNRTHPSTINGDKLLLEIALSNLISNAIKYVYMEGIVEIHLKEVENKLVVKISDNGIGIPGEELKNIFKDFYRASNIKKEIHEGTGLGLSFVKQIVEKHGGKIKVESPSELTDEKHPGCCFKISFPIPS